MRPDEFRWRTPLGQWIRDHRVSTLVQELQARRISASVRAVQHWTAGRTFPRPDAVEAIVELSGGTLSPNDFYEHRRQVLNVRSGNPRQP